MSVAAHYRRLHSQCDCARWTSMSICRSLPARTTCNLCKLACRCVSWLQASRWKRCSLCGLQLSHRCNKLGPYSAGAARRARNRWPPRSGRELVARADSLTKLSRSSASLHERETGSTVRVPSTWRWRCTPLQTERPSSWCSWACRWDLVVNLRQLEWFAHYKDRHSPGIFVACVGLKVFIARLVLLQHREDGSFSFRAHGGPFAHDHRPKFAD